MVKLPSFKTLDELVAFWETHDFTDYIDEMEEVAPEIGLPQRSHGTLRIQLDSTLLQRLQEIASERGLDPDALARLWLEERLAQEVDR
ncbi:MAG: CopG family antitoxin [Anaerolineae bacterium]